MADDPERASPQRRRRIVFFEAAVLGHSATYLRLCAEHWQRHVQGAEMIVVASPSFAATHRELVESWREGGHNVQFIAYSREEEAKLQNSPASKVVALDSFLSAELDPEDRTVRHWRLACAYARRLEATHLLFMYFDACYLPAACWMEAPCSFSGLYFRPTFHYDQFPGCTDAPQEKIQRLQEKFTLARVLRHPQLRTLYCLDPFAVTAAGDDYANLVALPDPVPRPNTHAADSSHLRARLGIETGRKVFLFCGELSPRKGVLQLLEGLSYLPSGLAERVCLLVMGACNAIRRQQLDDAIERVARTGPFQIIRRHEHVPESEFEDCFRVADAVLVPYQRHVGSSGILLRAAAHGRPVLCQDYGLMGEIVGRHGLGITIDSTKPRAIAAGLDRLLQAPPGTLFDAAKAGNLLENHTEDAFADVLFGRFRSEESV